MCVRVPREKVWQEMCPRDKPTHGGFKMAVISSVLLASADLTERGAAPYLDGLLSGFTRGFHESLSHFTLSYISPLSSLFVIRNRIHEHFSSSGEKLCFRSTYLEKNRPFLHLYSSLIFILNFCLKLGHILRFCIFDSVFYAFVLNKITSIVFILEVVFI